jgi:hypothetical protein
VVAIEPAGREIACWFDPRPRAAVRRTLRPLLFGGLEYRAHHPPQHVFTDEELRAVPVPVRLVLAERSVIHRARDVEQRVKALNPLFDVEVVPHTTHALPLQRPELVTDRILTAAVAGQPRSASCGTAGAMPSIQAAGEPVVGVTIAVRTPSFAYSAIDRTKSSRVSGVGRGLLARIVLRISS